MPKWKAAQLKFKPKNPITHQDQILSISLILNYVLFVKYQMWIINNNAQWSSALASNSLS